MSCTLSGNWIFRVLGEQRRRLKVRVEGAIRNINKRNSGQFMYVMRWTRITAEIKNHLLPFPEYVSSEIWRSKDEDKMGERLRVIRWILSMGGCSYGVGFWDGFCMTTDSVHLRGDMDGWFQIFCWVAGGRRFLHGNLVMHMWEVTWTNDYVTNVAAGRGQMSACGDPLPNTLLLYINIYRFNGSINLSKTDMVYIVSKHNFMLFLSWDVKDA